MGELVVDVISFQKIFGLCGLKCHIMEIWTDVTLDDTRTTDGRTTECEDRARILETEFAISDWRYIEKGVGECKMGVSFCRGDKRKLCGFCTKETPEKYW